MWVDDRNEWTSIDSHSIVENTVSSLCWDVGEDSESDSESVYVSSSEEVFVLSCSLISFVWVSTDSLDSMVVSNGWKEEIKDWLEPRRRGFFYTLK